MTTQSDPLRHSDRRRLFFVFFAPMLSWVAQLVIGYGLVGVACSTGSKAPFYILTIVVGAITVLAGVWAFLSWRGSGRDESHLSSSAPPQDFVELMGVLMALIFLVLIGATGLYGAALDPCARISMPLP